MHSPMPARSLHDWPRLLLEACRRIEQAPRVPTLSALAGQLGVSAFELQRQFRRRLGVSPKGYARALQLSRLTRHLARERSTLDATLAAGFESSAAAYAVAGGALGLPPGRLRGERQIGWWLGLSDLGWMLLAATDRGICWLAFGEQPDQLLRALYAAFPRARFRNDEPRLVGWFEQVREFVLLPRDALDLPLDIQGTAFQARVWQALRRIPLGETRTYGELARQLQSPGASRAVASACARNRLALLIPCHRVVGAGGRTGGYRWGAERKSALLAREAQAPARKSRAAG